MKKIFGVLVAILLVCIVVLCVENKKLSDQLKNQTEACVELSAQNKKLSEQIENLRTENEELKNIIVNLEQQINNTITDDFYLSMVFPYDGHYYQEKTGNITFYQDQACRIRLRYVRFMSQNVEYKNRADGFGLYCYRLYTGEICYSKEKAKLIREDMCD